MSYYMYELNTLIEKHIFTMSVTPTYPFIYSDNGENKEGRLTWTELQRMVIFDNNLLNFTRTEACQKKYDKYLSDTCHFDEEMLKQKIMKNLVIDNKRSFGIKNKFVFRENNYPYNFGNNKHYLLWVHPDCEKDIKDRLTKKTFLNEVIDDILLTYHNQLNELQRKERLLFRNAMVNKSVPSIEHFHVIFKME